MSQSPLEILLGGTEMGHTGFELWLTFFIVTTPCFHPYRKKNILLSEIMLLFIQIVKFLM